MANFEINYKPTMPTNTNLAIGCIGSGFIMRDVQLVAYNNAGLDVVAIASRTPANAQAAADARGIDTVYDTWQELLDDQRIAILDIAYPPDQQLAIIREAVKRKHIKGILAQKPLAMNYEEAKEAVGLCTNAGIVLSVNQNMRYDQSMRALKSLLDQGVLGQPVLATIEMRAIPHWQPFLEEYDRLTLLNMSIHHLDIFRFLFGDPDRVFASVTQDPRTGFEHKDGIALYILEYANGFRASAWDDVWTGPVREGAEGDMYIKWRVEGTDGMAHGTIGWPKYGDSDSQSTLQFSTKQEPNMWFTPTWPEVWFPDAFIGPMAQLIEAVQNGAEPELSGEDNLKTMALIDAAYHSAETHNSVHIADMM
ncbi:Gfo/Idh/MocA family protein [Candidatus Leptofilum sp.]|uniref:Gfo/Idh/MocA family protein n=1 Tax=Candidatus Leptofilum sp. TaxID=3241576 RepID=UPI003B5C99F5